MTMTPKRIAELDAVMAKATAGEWEIYGEPEVGLPPSLFSCETTTWPSRTPLEPLCRDDESAIVALHNAYPLLTATIDAQAAEIARLRDAMRDVQARITEAIDLERISAAQALEEMAPIVSAALTGAA